MLKWKRLTLITLSTSILLTQGVPLPYLAYAMEEARNAPVNGEVKFSWTTADQVGVGSTFNPYEGLQAIDADGDNVSILTQVEGEVDTSRVGVYPISYSIKNVDGQTFTMTRQIEVVASTSVSDEQTGEESNGSNEQETQTTDSQVNATEESLPNDETSQENSSPSLNDVDWVLYDRSSKQELIKFGVNVETGQYVAEFMEDLKALLVEADEDTLNQEILKLRILSSQQEEKFAMTLKVRDLLGETEELNLLNELSYEIGDQLSLIPVIHEKTILVVNGVTDGDVSKEQEDYSDGVESEDFIRNVRFVLHETGLSNLYNEAPIIEGIEDTVVPSFEFFDPKDGVTVKDDKDDNLLSQLISTIEQVDDTIQKVTYQVTDSWGRTTEAIRHVTQDPSLEQLINPLTAGDGEPSQPTTTLADNTITVRGIRFGGDGADTDLRFKLTFDTKTRKIKVINQDGRSMNSRVEGTYFKLVLYKEDGTIKKELELLGSDRSNTTKLDELKYQGWRYDHGDYISLYHYEPEHKLNIGGTVQNAPAGITSFETGLTRNLLEANRFELTSTGLKFTSNQAPTITFPTDDEGNEDLIVKHGDNIDVWKGVTVSDDFSISDSNVDGVSYDIGTYTLTYMATDNWGVTMTRTRTLRVLPKNDIETVEINIQSSDNHPMFTLLFDEVESRFKLKNLTDDKTKQFNSGNKSIELVITVYTSDSKVRRTFNIKGTDTIDSKNVQSLMDYKYMSGDYIQVIPTDPTKVIINGPITNDNQEISSSLEALDGFKNGRFHLASTGEFKYVYNQAPQITAPDLTVTRGEEINIFEEVTITDDHDRNITPSEDNMKVKIISGSESHTGEIIYAITYTDSWGRSTTTTRKVILVGSSPIEDYHFNLLNEKKESILRFSLDSVTKKFTSVFGNDQSYITGNSDDTAFKLTVYSSDHQERSTFELKYEEVIDETVEKRLENLLFEDGGYIVLEVYQYDAIQMLKINENEGEQTLESQADIVQSQSNKNQLFASEDEMLYSRIEISNDDGLVKKYNQAPQILGATDVKVVYGTNFDKSHDVTVNDPDQQNVEFVVTGEQVDTNELGTYILTYTATDAYGRKAEVTRRVTVIPVYTTNEVQYNNPDKNLSFSIGINEGGTGFTVNSLSAPEHIPEDTTDEDSESASPSTPEQEVVPIEEGPEQGNMTPALFEFSVYNQNGQLQKKIEIIEETNTLVTLKVSSEANDESISQVTSVHELEQVLSAIQVRPDYYFAVKASDLTKLKVTGQLNKNSQTELTSVDYTNLTDSNLDVVENVRFKLTENIVEVVYNKAPVITIQPTRSDSTESEGDSADSESDSITLTVDQPTDDSSNTSTAIVRNKALSIEEYDLLEGVSISDDKDNLTITVEDVKVEDDMLVSTLDQSVATIGETYTVTYCVTDSWGRQSDPVEREVTIKSAMDDVEIKYHRAGTSLQDIGLALTIGFNMSDQRLTFSTEGANGNSFKDASGAAYGTLSILSADGTPIYKKILGLNDNTIENQGEFTNGVTNRPSDVVSDLTSTQINYGTQFKFQILQVPHLFIEGNVVNAQENYSEGAKLNAILEQSTFIVTPEGLKQEYNSEVQQQYSQFTWLNGVAGSKSANVKFDTSDPSNLHFDVEYYGREPLDTLHKGDTLFIFRISKNGQAERTYSIRGSEYPERFEELFGNSSSLDIKSMRPGDYMKIESLQERRLSNLKFYNLLEGLYFPEKVDYSAVITNRDYFDNVRFYFGTGGITPVYNAGPVFYGADETDIIVGTQFNAQDGVTVTDEIDKLLGQSLGYTVSGENFDTSQPGTHTITYRATDSWGRQTVHTRTVNVRPKTFENKVQVFAESDKNNPAFEIVLDNLATSADSKALSQGMYQVNRLSDDTLDVNRPTEEVFKIWIMNSSNERKAFVTLLGRDTATSSKLDVLEKIPYESGDYIKVWRAPSINSSDNTIDTLKITGTIRGENDQDYTTGTFNVEYMNNVVFQIPNMDTENLKAIYNKAAEFIGVADKTIYYGDVFEPLNGVSVNDDKTIDLTLSENNVSHNVFTDRIGQYPVTYTFTDSWGRTTTQTITVKVISKVTQNTIEVYGDNDSGQSELKFTIGFNEAVNKFTIQPSQTIQPLQSLSSVDSSNSSNSTELMNLTVYDRFGGVKHELSITITDTVESVTSKFTELSQLSITATDAVMISHTDSSDIKIKGTVNNQSKDYSTGLATAEEMKQRRFKFSNEGLTEIQASTNTVDFIGLDDVTTTRGDLEFDVLEGVSIVHSGEIIDIDNISVEGFDLFTAGIQTVTYKVVDSWGMEFRETRNITVLPYNSLETVTTTLQSSVNGVQSPLAFINFDAIEMKLVPSVPKMNNSSKLIEWFKKFIPRIISEDNHDQNVEVDVELAIFSEDGTKKNSVSLTASDLSNIDTLNSLLEDFTFEYGDFLGIQTNESYEYFMDGAVAMPLDEQLNKKSMKEVRYYITEDGLTLVNNKAPEVTVRDSVHRLGEAINFNEALTIEDDLDEKIYDIEIESENYDQYMPGIYQVTYVVTDSWGLQSEATANVSVKSDIDKSFIILKDQNKQELVKMGFDSVKRQLIWEYNQDKTLTPTGEHDLLFTISIYTSENKQQGKSIPIYGDDTVLMIKLKFILLQWLYKYTYGNQIHIEAADSAKELVSITNVSTSMSDNLKDVNYGQGVSNVDYLNHVRFQIEYDALYAIYNEAPVIEVTQSTIDSEKKLNVEEYQLLDNIVARDDKDSYDTLTIRMEYYNNTYPESNDSIQTFLLDSPANPDDLNDPTNPKRLQIGENTIKYIVIDSWGRESEAQKVTLNLVSAMDNLSLKFLYAASGLIADMNNLAMTIEFDMKNNRLNLTDQSTNGEFKFNQIQYGALSIINPDNPDTPIFKGVLGQQRTFEGSSSEFNDATVYRRVDAFINAIDDIHIEYGYEIKIKIYQSPFLYIDGSVINAQEDYSQGVNIAEILNESTFKITEEGLVQQYEASINPAENHNTIAWYSGVSGNIQFKLNVNPSTQRLTVDVVDRNEPMDTLYKTGNLFSIYVYSSNGAEKYGATFNGGQKAGEVETAFNNKEFSIADGDYLVIKILPTNRDRKANFRIYGDIKRNKDSLNQIDYANGVPDVSYFNEARFYFTTEGLRLDYNEAPVFTGLTDVMLLKNGDQQEAVDLTGGVTVTDDNTSNISYVIQDASGRVISNPESYSPTSLGAVEVYYVATDSLGRTAKEPRFIWLQSPSTIEVTSPDKLIVQEADPALRTEEAVYQYLIDLVTVYDIEDDEGPGHGKGIIVTKDNIQTDFNPMKTGQYPVTYTVRDSDGNESTATFTVNVVRSINVSVPRNNIPFQVVTNLLGDTAEGQEFISGTIKIQNNYVTDVNVSVKALTVSSQQSSTRNGEFTLVDPEELDDDYWNSLSEEATMSQMALGLYQKSGNMIGDKVPTKDSPIWLTTDMTKTSIGVLPKRALDSSEPTEAVLSFTAKYGKNFTSGKHRMKFTMVLEFD